MHNGWTRRGRQVTGVTPDCTLPQKRAGPDGGSARGRIGPGGPTGLQNQLGSFWTSVGSIPTRSRHALSYLCRTFATWLQGTCLSHSRRLHDICCGPWHSPCVRTGRLAGSEPCPLLRSVMRNEDQDCGLAATPRGAATRRRLYPSTSRTFCASAAALNGFCRNASPRSSI